MSVFYGKSLFSASAWYEKQYQFSNERLMDVEYLMRICAENRLRSIFIHANLYGKRYYCERLSVIVNKVVPFTTYGEREHLASS